MIDFHVETPEERERSLRRLRERVGLGPRQRPTMTREELERQARELLAPIVITDPTPEVQALIELVVQACCGVVMPETGCMCPRCQRRRALMRELRSTFLLES